MFLKQLLFAALVAAQNQQILDLDNNIQQNAAEIQFRQLQDPVADPAPTTPAAETPAADPAPTTPAGDPAPATPAADPLPALLTAVLSLNNTSMYGTYYTGSSYALKAFSDCMKLTFLITAYESEKVSFNITDRRSMLKGGRNYIRSVQNYVCSIDPAITDATKIQDTKTSQLVCVNSVLPERKLNIISNFGDKALQFITLYSPCVETDCTNQFIIHAVPPKLQISQSSVTVSVAEDGKNVLAPLELQNAVTVIQDFMKQLPEDVNKKLPTSVSAFDFTNLKAISFQDSQQCAN